MSGTHVREEPRIARTLRLDRGSALTLLRDLARDRGVLAELRRLWAQEIGATTLCFTGDEQVLVQLAARVASGSLVIGRVPHVQPMSPPEGEDALAGAAQAAAEEAAKKDDKKAEEAAEKSWIQITVVNLATGAPLAGVPLLITPSGGSEAEHKTDDKGLVRLDKIAAGPCVVRCKMDDPKREDTFIFMGSAGGSPPPPAQGSGASKKKKGGTPCLVRADSHKVQTGDTLDSLAKSIGSTWKKVAKFNFGTDDPKKINGFLRSRVGCTKKSADGKNYIFDDSDDPGIVLLPMEFEAKGMETGSAYTIEVVPAEDQANWTFSM